MKIKLNKIKKRLRKLLFFPITHLFLTALLLFFLALIIGGFSFYKYVFLTQRVEILVKTSELLKENIYQEVLRTWQEQEKKFKEIDLKEYTNPFEEKIFESEELTE